MKRHEQRRSAWGDAHRAAGAHHTPTAPGATTHGPAPGGWGAGVNRGGSVAPARHTPTGMNCVFRLYQVLAGQAIAGKKCDLHGAHHHRKRNQCDLSGFQLARMEPTQRGG